MAFPARGRRAADGPAKRSIQFKTSRTPPNPAGGAWSCPAVVWGKPAGSSGDGGKRGRLPGQAGSQRTNPFLQSAKWTQSAASGTKPSAFAESPVSSTIDASASSSGPVSTAASRGPRAAVRNGWGATSSWQGNRFDDDQNDPSSAPVTEGPAANSCTQAPAGTVGVSCPTARIQSSLARLSESLLEGQCARPGITSPWVAAPGGASPAQPVSRNAWTGS